MNWKIDTVSKYCDLVIDCVNQTAPISFIPTNYKMLRTTNVKEGHIDFDKIRYVEKQIFDRWTRRGQPKYGDVLFTREAPVGQVGRFTSKTGNYFLGQRLFMYRTNPEKLDWNYLAYILQSEQIQGWVKNIAYGATVPHLKVGDMEHLRLPVPKLKIQKQIAKILSSFDDLIENDVKQIKLLEEKAKIIYEEWFVKFNIDNKKLKIDKSTNLPFGWIKKPITKFETFKKDLGKQKKFDEAKSYYQTSDIDGTFVKTKGTKVSWINKPSRAQMKPTNNSVWFARMSNTYKILCFNKNNKKFQDNCILSTGFTGFKTVNEVYLPFLYFTINSPFFHELKDIYASGATQVALNNSSMDFMNIVEPDKNSIEKFGVKFLPLLKRIIILKNEIDLLKELKNIILPRFFIGVIDPNKL